jgi:uncharacterized protein (TIGR03437 family)
MIIIGSRFGASGEVRRVATLTAALLLGAAAHAQVPVITTVVGTDWIFSPEGKPATSLALSTEASNIAADSHGNLYIADSVNNVVVKVGPDGIAHVLAGNGFQGFSGNGGPAVNASLNYPRAVAVDGKGNVFIADADNYQIREVTPAGVISTFAGTGVFGYFGDGGMAASARFSFMDCLAFDNAGNLLVCDYDNARVRRITPAGLISTIAGNGVSGYSGDHGPATSAKLDGPTAVVCDSTGQIYIAEWFNDSVRRIALDGTISTIAGGQYGSAGDKGQATAASLANPSGLALDSSGNLYIADTNNNKIRVVSSTGIINTAAGNGSLGFAGDNSLPSQAEFRFPFGLSFDSSGRLLVADTGNERIRAIQLGVTMQTVAGNGLFRSTVDGTPALQGFLFSPTGVAIDSSGVLYVSDTADNLVKKITTSDLTDRWAGIGIPSINGYGGAATTAGLDNPTGLTIDPRGNLIIAASGDGVILSVGSNDVDTVIAGYGTGGDGGPATSAFLDYPVGVAYDSAGNLYIADQGSNRIRKVSTSGTITTYAGNGASRSAGDGGSATLASLNAPGGVAVDSSGNVYVSEVEGFRIRKITTAGTIYTIAGTGTFGSTGDGGLATKANLGTITGLALDASGNLYFSETSASKVRQVSPSGILTTVAGTGSPGFSGDGGPASLANLNFPNGLTFGKDGTLYIADVGNNRIRAVRTAGVTISASPSQLSFTVTSGGVAPPPQTIQVQSSPAGYPYSASATGGSWLSVSPANGALPATLQIGVDPTSLSAGSYQGTISVLAAGYSVGQTIAVSVTVTAPIPGKLAVSNPNLSFSLPQASGATTAQLTVSNQGAGSIRYTAAASSSGNWLQVSPMSGSVTASGPASLTITAIPGNLAPGTYSGTITMASPDTGDNIPIPVTLAISASITKILLSQPGLTFTAVELGGAPLPQNFGILNVGQGSMGWTAQVSTLSGGSTWLTIDQNNGTVATPFTSVSLINVSINPSGLTAAQSPYYGQIQILVGGADNSPQSVSIVLNVLPAGSNPGAEVRPTGLIFIGTPGNSPGSQNVTVSNSTAGPTTFGGQFYTVPTGGNWVQFLPVNATVQPNAPAQIVVQSDYTNLTVGTVHGFLSLGFLDGSSRTVNVLTVVAPSGSSPNLSGAVRDDVSTKCPPLSVVPTALTDPTSAVKLSQPATLSVRVVDSCGNAMTGGAVTATFSNGDPPSKLTHVGNGSAGSPQGTWTGTWTPQNGKQSPVTVAFAAINEQGVTPLIGSATIAVALQSQNSTPLAVGAANAASGALTYVAPGGLVSIYGSLLSDQSGQPGSTPFPKLYDGTQVLMAGVPLPLRYVSGTQVNAQVPFEVAANTALQLTIQRDNTLSVPLNVIVAPAQPAVYTQDRSGSGPGVIVDASQAYRVVTPQTPAAVGDLLVLYCNSLGAVSPPVPTGTPAPSVEPLARTVNPVAVTIGGIAATVTFAGLAPGFPDLYQVNATVPAGVASGSAVPVILNVAGQTSPVVTLAIQ